jgi:hypothetical protein
MVGRDDRPEIMHFMTASDYRVFCDKVEQQLKQLGQAYNLDRREGSYGLQSKPGMHLGLANLAQLCNQLPKAEWDESINQHIRSLLSQSPDGSAPTTFQDAKTGMKVRLAPLDFNVPLDILVTCPMSDSFHTYFAHDLPNSVESLKAETFQSWNVSRRELWDLALKNIWEQDPVSHETIAFGDSNLELLAADSLFAASHLFMLERHFPDAPKAGLIVAVPNRHAILCKRLEAVDSMQALGGMKFLATKMFEDGPGSISPEVFWWRPGRLEKLEVTLSDRGVDFTPTQEFIDLWE